MSEIKYFKCHYCNCVYEPIDFDKHSLCSDFYNFILVEIIKKLEKQLKICRDIQDKDVE